MGLNDEREKLRQAEEWLSLHPASQQFRAAHEHVIWVCNSDTVSTALRDEAARILRELGYEEQGSEYA